jgi:hypothetical protein
LLEMPYHSGSIEVDDGDEKNTKGVIEKETRINNAGHTRINNFSWKRNLDDPVTMTEQ